MVTTTKAIFPGGGLLYRKGRDAHQEISNEPLKIPGCGLRGISPPKDTNQKHIGKQLV